MRVDHPRRSELRRGNHRGSYIEEEMVRVWRERAYEGLPRAPDEDEPPEKKELRESFGWGLLPLGADISRVLRGMC